MNAELASATFPALGTTATVVVTDPGSLSAARAALEDVLADIDRSCSRFRADSELSRVNDEPGRPVKVGSTLLDAIDVALRAARLTGGDVDPTVGTGMRLLGYDRDFASIAASGAALTCVVERVPGWWRIDVDHTAQTVRVADGVELDLGATAKAFAADRAAARILDGTGVGVLVSLGGDIAVAGDPPDDGWPIHVTDDHAAGPDAPGETVAIREGAMATSSTTVRRWRRGQEALHHIVDPSTGMSTAPYWRTVTVVARTCVDANVATTATVVRGERARSWLDDLGLAGRLVHNDGTVAYVGGWPTAA